MNTSGAELLPPTLLNVVNTHLHYSMGEGRGEGAPLQVSFLILRSTSASQFTVSTNHTQYLLSCC